MAIIIWNLIFKTLIILIFFILSHLPRSLFIHHLLIVSAHIFLSWCRYGCDRALYKTVISALRPWNSWSSHSWNSSFRLRNLDIILVNFESIYRQFWLCDLDWNLALLQNLLNLRLLLFLGLWKDSVSLVALLLNSKGLLLWDLRHSYTVILINSFNHSWVINLLELSLLLSSHSIDIVSQEFLMVVCWVDVSFTVSMESWFAEVSCKGWIG